MHDVTMSDAIFLKSIVIIMTLTTMLAFRPLQCIHSKRGEKSEFLGEVSLILKTSPMSRMALRVGLFTL